MFGRNIAVLVTAAIVCGAFTPADAKHKTNVSTLNAAEVPPHLLPAAPPPVAPGTPPHLLPVGVTLPAHTINSIHAATSTHSTSSTHSTNSIHAPKSKTSRAASRLMPASASGVVLAGSSAAEPVSAHLKVEIEHDVSSSSVQVGDAVTARVTEDCVIDGIQIDKSCKLIGHVDKVLAPRSGWEALRDRERRFKKGGAFSIVFDKLILGNGKTIGVEGRIGAQKETRLATAEQKSDRGWREVKANKDGVIVKADDSFSPTKRRTLNTVSVVSGVATFPFGVPGMLVDMATNGAIGAASTTKKTTTVSTAPGFHTINGVTTADDDGEEPSKTGAFVKSAVDSLPPLRVYNFIRSTGSDTTLKRGDQLDVELTF